MTICQVCSKPFDKQRMGQVVCSPRCAQKVPKVRAKAERDTTRKRKEAAEPRSKVLARAKTIIQKFRRLEELSKGRGCMSCLRTQEEVQSTDGWKPGGAWDGAHFVSKGASPELALEPRNIWLNCKSCNGGAGNYTRKNHTVMQNYETNLRAAEGDALVDWLKGPHEPAKHTIDDLRAIIALYRGKLKELSNDN